MGKSPSSTMQWFMRTYGSSWRVFFQGTWWRRWVSAENGLPAGASRSSLWTARHLLFPNHIDKTRETEAELQSQRKVTLLITSSQVLSQEPDLMPGSCFLNNNTVRSRDKIYGSCICSCVCICSVKILKPDFIGKRLITFGFYIFKDHSYQNYQTH